MATKIPTVHKQASLWIRKFGNAILDAPNSGIMAIGVGKKSTGPLDDNSEFCLTGFVQSKLT